ncbi:M48 family metallopeptidase [Aurantiacibacter luteus]|uniref:Peptidase M48 domain-containing protein n=1 Tax=Aurantiacibacter luteus TaxID=1581420 RepID=A0A0G9MTR5_9SPHN|nr:M48 family metalloprotease [Aurantiacibacter luteus]KLE34115.1 hypothetical protein AAW00_07470 [Aurantiacibacter luteus]
MHRADCATLTCAPEFSEWLSLLIFASYPIAIGAAFALFHVTGLSRRLSGRLEATGWRGFVQDGLYGAALAAFVWLACLPVGYWRRFVLDNPGIKVTFNGPMPEGNREPSLAERHWYWITEQLADVPMFVIGAAIAAPILLAIMRRVPRHYWLLPALGLAAAVAVDSYSHVFDTVRPLPEGPLAQDIADIAEAAGLAADRVYLGEAQPMLGLDIAQARWLGGRQVAIIGEPFFNTLRISPEAYSPRYRPVTAAEVRAVAAHEIAHVKHDHAVLLPLLLTLAAILFAWLAALLLRRGGIDVAKRANLPLVALAFGAMACALLPVRANLWRVAENQADATGLDIGRDPEGFALLAVRLARGGQLDWQPVTHALLATHPDPLDRIERAAAWSRDNAAADWRAEGLAGPVRMRVRQGDFTYYDWPDEP